MAYGAWKGARWRTVWNNGYYRIDVQWDFCQDIENNKTKVSLMGQRVASLNGSYSFIYTATQVGIGDFGGTKYPEERNVSVSGGGTATIDLTDRHSEINHNADGSWPSGKVCGWWRFNVPLGGQNHTPTIGWTAFNIDGEIPAIPRATTPTLSASSVAMGSAVTINLPRASSSFTHNVTYRFGNATGTINSNAGTSCSWTPPVSLAQQIKTSTSGVGTITVQTKNGSTVIGTKTINITLTVPASVVPTISGHVVAEATANIASKFGAFVQSKSTLKVTTTASGAQGSTITAYKTVIEGRSYTGSPCTSAAISGSGTIAVTTTVTDSRGRTASKTTNVTVVAYSPPQISISTVVRTSDEATTALCSYSYSIASVGSKNDKSFAIQYLNGSTWTDITRMSTDYAKSGSVTSGAIFGVDATTQVRFIAQDYFTQVIIQKEVGPTFTLMNLGAGGKSLAIGRLSSNAGEFELGLRMRPYNGWYVHRASSLNSNTHVGLIRITILTPWANDPIVIRLNQRSQLKMQTLTVKFQNISTTDPALAQFYKDELFGEYLIRKVSPGVWEIAFKVGDNPDVYDILDVQSTGIKDNKYQISYISTGYTSSPGGTGAASYLTNALYPVGAVYLTYTSTSPAGYLGGTWVQFSQGRVLLGQGTGSDGTTSMTFGASSTGGKYTSDLRAAIGAVNGDVGSIGYHAVSVISGVSYNSNLGVRASTPGTISSVNHATAVTQVDGSAPTHVQPYQTVYAWRRTA